VKVKVRVLVEAFTGAICCLMILLGIQLATRANQLATRANQHMRSNMLCVDILSTRESN
jgi:hypothetical protein